jgi:magnesium-transporting ATPase (P-type)
MFLSLALSLCKRFSSFRLILTTRCFINIHRDLTSSHYLFSMITVVQTINLIFNITPDTIPQFRYLPQAYIQALFIITAIITLGGCTTFVRGRGPWSTLDAIRLFVPIVVSVGAWMQKKGEVDTERSLGELDKARYRMKGA